MRLNRPIAVVLGLASVAPLVYVVVFSSYLLPQLMAAGNPGGIGASSFFHMFETVLLLHVVTFFLTAALLAFYSIRIHRGGTIPVPKRRVWTMLLFIGNILALPVVWYGCIWRPLTREND